jgi:hypothetical protein
MTQEEKDLLLKDLSGRQTHNVKCQVFNDAKPYTLSGVLHNKPYSQLYFEELDWKEHDGFVGVEYCKPYLFPLSSMTEEQLAELKEFADLKYEHNTLELAEWGWDNTYKTLEFWLEEIPSYCVIKVFDWLDENNFDYRGLIPLNLAIDATNLNIYKS